MLRPILILLLLAMTTWLATSAVLPPHGGGSEEETTAIWRRTDQGWQRADAWLKSNDHLKREPVPPLYPVALLPLIVAVGIVSLILGQPKNPPKAPLASDGRPHFVRDRRRQHRVRTEG